MDIGRVIEIVRSLKEDAPTMSLGSPQTGSNPPTGKIAGTKEAGDDPPVFSPKPTYAKGGINSRRWWLQYLKKNK